LTEQAVVFGSSAALVGVVTEAEGAPAAGPPTAVVLINAGVVHHVGPHRLYVELARRLARMGFVVLRFDHSGIGDSGVREDHLPFDQTSVSEVQDAMEWLSRERGSERFVLLGLCSGTLTAFRTANKDRRVAGLALLTALLEDPSTVSEAAIQQAVDQKIARSYTTQKAFDTRSWKKLVTGQANYRRIVRVLVKDLRSRLQRRKAVPSTHSEVVSHLLALLERGVPVVFIFAEPTTVLEYFRMTIAPYLSTLRERGALDLHVLERSDHTFSGIRHRAELVDVVADWLRTSSRGRHGTAEASSSSVPR
jgi:alpha-beta hydrolase superfamily lysophospholipase